MAFVYVHFLVVLGNLRRGLQFIKLGSSLATASVRRFGINGHKV